jgi:PKD repeat protein
MKGLLSSAILVAAVVLAGCTVHQTEAPALAGPSDLALSIRVTALPDSISQDGGSQSSIQVTAIGPDGRPKSGLPIRLDMFVNGVGQDYGTLSTRTMVTNASGVATVVYTAPPSPVGGLFGSCQGLPGNCVQIVATASGSGFETSSPETVTIRLVPPGVILPPASTPTALFTFSPPTAAANAPVAFDATSSCAGQAGATGGCLPSNNVLTGFSWSFGDGQSGSGATTSHVFTSAGTYNVTLTVTNDRGLTASTTRVVTVGAGSGPTAVFVFSPTPVVANVETFFDASASRPAPGHTIVSYSWNWGDGDPISTRSTPLEAHDFGAAGTYIVVLTVTDEAGQQGTTTQSVSVTSGAPTAVFTTLVTNAATHTIQADGSGSTASGSATIVTYTFTWGDGTTTTGSNPVQSHTYAATNTYPVRLTVVDSLGRTSSSLPANVAVP